MKTRRFHFPQSGGRGQRGMTLLVGLVMLVLLSLLAIYGARTVIMENIMARNTRDRDLAFQSAEAAMRDAEARIAAYDASFAGTGLIDHHPVDPVTKVPDDLDLIVKGTTAAYWTGTYRWAAGNTIEMRDTDGSYSGTLSSLPRYVVERLPDISNGNTCPSSSATYDRRRYRVTAMAVGRSADTRVMLQSEYRYDSPRCPE